MSWSLTIGRFGGTAIRIHFTFFLFLIWIWTVYYRQGGTTAAWQGVLFVSLLFLCVLLHEFGHILVARRFGVKAPDVTLWPFGGIANLDQIPEKPSQEFLIAIAGPLVNVAIFLLLLLYLGSTTPAAALMQVDESNVGLAAKLAGANLFLALFNLIPAFPMDGGRILRALLALKFSFARATEIAATVGQGFAVLLGIFGLFGNPMLVIIAIFVFFAASGEAGHVQMRQIARGAIVADAMITKFETLGPQSRVQDAMEALIRTTQKEFPVVDGAGKLRGVLTRDAMIRALQAHGPNAPVLDAMDAEVPTISARASLETALKTLSGQSKPVVGVLNAAGKLVGLLTAENLGEMMMIRSAKRSRAGTPKAPGPSDMRGPWGRA
jgi:Zn-dependent protease/CBS domain-containing protein